MKAAAMFTFWCISMAQHKSILYTPITGQYLQLILSPTAIKIKEKIIQLNITINVVNKL